MIDTESLKVATLNAGGTDWKWWDSNSYRRLTFEKQGRRDGDALSACVQSDGHPDVLMAPGVREFIEMASPANVMTLIDRFAAAADGLMDAWKVIDELGTAEMMDMTLPSAIRALATQPTVDKPTDTQSFKVDKSGGLQGCAPVVQDGWRLVPLPPTDIMVAATFSDRTSERSKVQFWEHHRAMLSNAIVAAPQPINAQRDAILYERALSELIDKIVPGLDSGDILVDASVASVALDQPTSAQPAASAEPRPDELAYFVDWNTKAATNESEVPPYDIARHAWLAGIRFADLFPVAAQPSVPDDWRKAVQAAYGYLWMINNEPGTPNQYAPEKAAYEARKLLRDLLTHTERGEGINTAMLAAAPIPLADGQEK